MQKDTSAITPLLPEIRAEGLLSWNQVSRLRETYRKTIANVRENRLPLPLEFHYDELEYVGERWHFVLRSLREIGNLNEGKSYVKYEDNDFVLEFVKAEKLEDGSEGEGPWFLDILRMRLLGSWVSEFISNDHKEEVMKYLNQWGMRLRKGGRTLLRSGPEIPVC